MRTLLSAFIFQDLVEEGLRVGVARRPFHLWQRLEAVKFVGIFTRHIAAPTKLARTVRGTASRASICSRIFATRLRLRLALRELDLEGLFEWEAQTSECLQVRHRLRVEDTQLLR